MNELYVSFEELVGRTLTAVNQTPEQIDFVCADGAIYRQFHSQDCCESVTVEDVCGDLNDIIGSPIVIAFESTSNENPAGVEKQCQDSFTWTFYKIDTAKGGVTIRWYGESNGYYSESVSFARIA